MGQNILTPSLIVLTRIYSKRNSWLTKNCLDKQYNTTDILGYPVGWRIASIMAISHWKILIRTQLWHTNIAILKKWRIFLKTNCTHSGHQLNVCNPTGKSTKKKFENKKKCKPKLAIRSQMQLRFAFIVSFVVWFALRYGGKFVVM